MATYSVKIRVEGSYIYITPEVEMHFLFGDSAYTLAKNTENSFFYGYDDNKNMCFMDNAGYKMAILDLYSNNMIYSDVNGFYKITTLTSNYITYTISNNVATICNKTSSRLGG